MSRVLGKEYARFKITSNVLVLGAFETGLFLSLSDEQKDKAQFAMSEFTRNEIWPKPVVTEISPVSTFFPAEDYHKDYYSKNSDNMYCNLVLRPKVEKFKEVFRDLLK